MSVEGAAALILVGGVLVFLACLFWLIRSHLEHQRLRDGGRAYDRTEGTAWFQDRARIERLRRKLHEHRAAARPSPPRQASQRPGRDIYGERVTGNTGNTGHPGGDDAEA